MAAKTRVILDAFTPNREQVRVHQRDPAEA
jgi:hypothetical protein